MICGLVQFIVIQHRLFFTRYSGSCLSCNHVFTFDYIVKWIKHNIPRSRVILQSIISADLGDGISADYYLKLQQQSENRSYMFYRDINYVYLTIKTFH